MTKRTRDNLVRLANGAVNRMFGDHGPFGWNVGHMFPEIVDLFSGHDDVKKMVALELFISTLKARIIEEML